VTLYQFSSSWLIYCAHQVFFAHDFFFIIFFSFYFTHLAASSLSSLHCALCVVLCCHITKRLAWVTCWPRTTNHKLSAVNRVSFGFLPPLFQIRTMDRLDALPTTQQQLVLKHWMKFIALTPTSGLTSSFPYLPFDCRGTALIPLCRPSVLFVCVCLGCGLRWAQGIVLDGSPEMLRDVDTATNFGTQFAVAGFLAFDGL